MARLLRCAPDFASYLGIDSSEAMLARARPKAGGDARIELRAVDATPIRALPGLERLESVAGGMTAVAVFRASGAARHPTDAGRSGDPPSLAP